MLQKSDTSVVLKREISI